MLSDSELVVELMGMEVEYAELNDVVLEVGPVTGAVEETVVPEDDSLELDVVE